MWPHPANHHPGMQSLNYSLYSVYHSDESLQAARIYCVGYSNVTQTTGHIAWLLQLSSDTLIFGTHEIWFHFRGYNFLLVQRHVYF